MANTDDTKKVIVINGEEYVKTGLTTSKDSSKALEFLEKKEGKK